MVFKIILLFISFISFYKALVLTPLKLEIQYFNPKYITSINMTMRKISRHSPYYINFEINTLTVAGNNVTVSMLGLEYISGRYIPTPFFLHYKLCEFFNEPLVGQVILQSLPADLRCPFPMGYIHVNNISLNFENFPYLPIFTWSDLRAQGRVDVNLTMTSTGELALMGYGIFTGTQTLKSKSIKIPSRKPKELMKGNDVFTEAHRSSKLNSLM